MESRRIGRRSIPTSGARWRRLPFPGIRECAMTTSGSRIFARELSRSGIGFGCGGRGEKSEREWEEIAPGLSDPLWRPVVEMHNASREIQTAAGSFDSVRLAPHSAQVDRQLGL